MLSGSVEYALRAVVFLAREGELHTTAQIADAPQVPAACLSKVLQGLERAVIVRSQRGIGGGMTLVPDPDELTIVDHRRRGECRRPVAENRIVPARSSRALRQTVRFAS